MEDAIVSRAEQDAVSELRVGVKQMYWMGIRGEDNHAYVGMAQERRVSETGKSIY